MSQTPTPPPTPPPFPARGQKPYDVILKTWLDYQINKAMEDGFDQDAALQEYLAGYAYGATDEGIPSDSLFFGIGNQIGKILSAPSGLDISGNEPGIVATVDLSGAPDVDGTYPGGVLWGLRNYLGSDLFPLHRMTTYGEGGLAIQVNQAGPADPVNWVNMVVFYPGDGMAVFGLDGVFDPVALAKDLLGKGNEPGIKVVTVKETPGGFASPPKDGGLLFDKDNVNEYPARIIRGNFDSIDVQFKMGGTGGVGDTWQTVMRVDKYGGLEMNPTGNYANNTFATAQALDAVASAIPSFFSSQPSFDADDYTENGVRVVKAGITSGLPAGFDTGLLTTSYGQVSDTGGLFSGQHQALQCVVTHRTWTRSRFNKIVYEPYSETAPAWSPWVESPGAGNEPGVLATFAGYLFNGTEGGLRTVNTDPEPKWEKEKGWRIVPDPSHNLVIQQWVGDLSSGYWRDTMVLEGMGPLFGSSPNVSYIPLSDSYGLEFYGDYPAPTDGRRPAQITYYLPVSLYGATSGGIDNWPTIFDDNGMYRVATENYVDAVKEKDTDWRVIDTTAGVNGAQISMTFMMRRIGDVVHYNGGIYGGSNGTPDVFPAGFRPDSRFETVSNNIQVVGVNDVDGTTSGYYVYGDGTVDPVQNTPVNGRNFLGSFITDNPWPNPLPGVSLAEYNS